MLIAAVPPLLVQTDANPGGLPKKVFDDIQAQVAANRSAFYRARPSTAFYNFNRPGVELDEAIVQNWWRQGMAGGAKAHYDGVVAFSRTDFTDDLKMITIPVLVMHGDDDQVVPYADSGPLSAQLRAPLPGGGLDQGPRQHRQQDGVVGGEADVWPTPATRPATPRRARPGCGGRTAGRPAAARRAHRR